MPHGKTKFNDGWLEKEIDEIQLKEWLCVVPTDVFAAKCTLCSEKFDIWSSGISQVKSHHKGKKHLLKFNARFKSQPQRSLMSKDGQIAVQSSENNALSQDMQIIKAEALWAMRIVETNSSFKSCTETTELFKDMFPDSIMAEKLQMKEKKVAYVLCHGLYKHFYDQLKKDISSCSTKFTIAFDETTNAQVKKQLDVYARYWSGESNLVISRYMSSVFLGHATADIILQELLDVLSDFKISLDNIICFSMDNPNVNRSLLNKFNDKKKDECGKQTVKLGACNLHVANNAFKHLLNTLHIDFDEFATDVHFFLKYSAVRREDYQCVEEVTLETTKFFIRHVGSRWLTAGPVAERLLDQWQNMSEYFLKFLPSQKSQEKNLNSERYKRIRAALKNPTMPSVLAFIAFTHKYFEAFSLCFQNEAPQIHVLYEEINKLMRHIMMQVIKDDIVGIKEGNELKEIDLGNKENLKKTNEIEIGMKGKNLIMNVNENDKKKCMMGIRKAIISSVNYMKSNFPFCNQILKDMETFRQLDVTKPVTHGLHAITRIATYLHFSENAIDCVREEWKQLKCDERAHEVLSKNSDARIDVYWSSLSGKGFKYNNLLNLIKTSLVLPHGNADPERGFSINNSMLKCTFNDSTIKCLRFVKDAIENYGGVRKVPITKLLLNDVKYSHKAYQQYLDKQNAEDDKLMKEKKKKEKDDAERLAKMKRKYEIDMEVSEVDMRISQIKEEKNIALGLIAEGTERLTKSVVEKNNVEMTVASTLVSQASEQLQKLEIKLSEAEIEKSSLLKKRIKCETK